MPRSSSLWSVLLLLAGATLVPGVAEAMYRAHAPCDPAIGDYDAALDADPALTATKAQVDASWRDLGRHGDPDRRAATRDRRSDWLCQVKQSCGTDIAAGRACIIDALQHQDRANRTLLGAAQSPPCATKSPAGAGSTACP